MINKTWGRKSVAFCLAVAVLTVYSMVTLAASPANVSGELTVTGTVTVNGQNAISGTTVFSDSVITTGDNSSATVSLGKLGRVELLPNSSLKLSFNELGLSGMLTAGRVRVASISGASAVISTSDGSAIAETVQNNTFIVDVTCGNTQVATQVGNVTLRSGGADKQVAAGKDATAGQATAGTRCTRLAAGGGAPSGGISGGALAAILLAAGGAVAAAIIGGTKGGDDDARGGGTTVISPTR
jgi:phage baseplate assembly protein gpV